MNSNKTMMDATVISHLHEPLKTEFQNLLEAPTTPENARRIEELRAVARSSAGGVNAPRPRVCLASCILAAAGLQLRFAYAMKLCTGRSNVNVSMTYGNTWWL
jgi:hypothetical protein